MLYQVRTKQTKACSGGDTQDLFERLREFPSDKIATSSENFLTYGQADKVPLKRSNRFVHHSVLFGPQNRQT